MGKRDRRILKAAEKRREKAVEKKSKLEEQAEQIEEQAATIDAQAIVIRSLKQLVANLEREKGEQSRTIEALQHERDQLRGSLRAARTLRNRYGKTAKRLEKALAALQSKTEPEEAHLAVQAAEAVLMSSSDDSVRTAMILSERGAVASGQRRRGSAASKPKVHVDEARSDSRAQYHRRQQRKRNK